MAADEWREERRNRRLRERRLPDELRWVITRVRRDDLRGMFVDAIFARVHDVAERRDLVVRHANPLGEQVTYVPVVHEREILRSLAANERYGLELRARVRDSLATAHSMKVDPSTFVSLIGDVTVDAPSYFGSFTPTADAGLGSATMLEAAPDGWFVWAARVALRLAKLKRSRGDVLPLNVLNLDAAAGGFARALHSQHDASVDVAVQEFDDLFTPTPLDNVSSGRLGPIRLAAYDLVVWSMPAPAVGGASNHRQRYRERALPDIGSVGPRRWRAAVDRMLRELVNPVLCAHGAAILRMPLGVRVDERGRRGYRDAPHLLDGLFDDLGRSGLRVVRLIRTDEVGSVNQPLVAKRRCPWVTVVLERVAMVHR